MKPLCLAIMALALAAPQAAFAKDQPPRRMVSMDCPRFPMRISLPSMRLSDALKHFHDIYRCGVSMDAGQVGDMDAGELNSTRISGRYTPLQALRIIVQNSPLKVQAIKGGFSIYQ